MVASALGFSSYARAAASRKQEERLRFSRRWALVSARRERRRVKVRKRIVAKLSFGRVCGESDGMNLGWIVERKRGKRGRTKVVSIYFCG